MGQEILYKCDPKKNTECRKTNCKFNPAAICGECDQTNKKEFAKLDGKGEPIVGVKIILDDKGRPIQLYEYDKGKLIKQLNK